jgi:hypothetical protein
MLLKSASRSRPVRPSPDDACYDGQGVSGTPSLALATCALGAVELIDDEKRNEQSNAFAAAPTGAAMSSSSSFSGAMMNTEVSATTKT